MLHPLIEQDFELFKNLLYEDRINIAEKIVDNLESFSIIRQWEDDHTPCFSAEIKITNLEKVSLSFLYTNIPPYQYYKESPGAKKDFINFIDGSLDMAQMYCIDHETLFDAQQDKYMTDHLIWAQIVQSLR